jgi:hypothetical protein
VEKFEDYKVIVYIILAVLYFLFSSRKKAKQKVPQNRPTSFEPVEDYKTIPTGQASKTSYQPKPLVSGTPKKVLNENPSPYNLEDVLKQFGQTENYSTKPLPQARETKTTTYETLENPVSKVVDYEDNSKEIDRNNTKQSVMLESDSSDQHMVGYKVQGQSENKYADMFKDPESAKAAFIAAEIFKRKYE